ncbi:Rid family detoxifying hydrolase [Hymenobacter actinosclerus]|uniref:2-iminobutanoate/2-iminopropanoate deaminase n=1 Tax=Hymenobacter actinosclerus TaxID=82805 RepID=A0A1I0I4Z3_9BACT|nr:Rid family detoxifying hydrolase [Hymenobacter actinosclerus]SET91340.1 2-iminobutanoate/2-iminopropanoate deaminase [Hymenobacter actinosclerus]
MQAIHHPDAPAAVGPYAQAIEANGFVFCSGQTPIVPASGKVEALTIEDQTRQVLANLATVLSARGLGLADIVKTTVFMKNFADFQRMNGVYAEQFGAHRPARSTVEVSRLPLDALVEIECVALLPPAGQ